jgi:putative ABC transport system permease protein
MYALAQDFRLCPGQPRKTPFFSKRMRAGGPQMKLPHLRSTVAQIDALLALQQVQPVTEAIANIEAPQRFNTDPIPAFSLSALLLALIGIHALVAFSASLRTHEIAIRMALGAQRPRIAGLVLSSAAKLALLGCTFGVLGSLTSLDGRSPAKWK